MDAVTGAMANLAPELLELLQEEYRLQTGLREQIESVSKELESIHAALGKVADVPSDQLDEQSKIWARDVREASFDMEDVLDSFLLRAGGRARDPPADTGRLRRALKKMAHLFSKAKARRDIAGTIGNIKKQLKEASERRIRYRIDDTVAKPAASSSTVDPRLSALYTQASRLVGVDEPRDALIKMLSLGDTDVADKKLKVVSVVGAGGFGKTTLVKAVYDKLKPQFDCGAFVPVGRNPDLKKVLRDVLIGLDKERFTKFDLLILDERQLIDELREFLLSKWYASLSQH
ncbi:hypothetical protein PR202_ga24631 [Eleusine coracana subsp. coracana]|uniref:Disease resistance protein n=1 Tax=Eleusine coracana subsp. coracana TaxID=191504 RepID=A0AAV5D9B3_ELECO|nr:hypothetical protein PR202_ga24631 [Eleusine coracana subsp. coracana]